MSSADKLDEPTFSADYGFDNEARPIRMNLDLRVRYPQSAYQLDQQIY